MNTRRCFLCVVLVLFVLSSCGQPTQSAERSFFALDTYITIQASGSDAERAIKAAEEHIRAREQKWSVTSPGSEIYTINHSGGGPVTISTDTSQLIDFALNISRQTGGALDPTIYPVLTAWGFTTGSYQVPSQEELEELLPLVDYRNIHLQGSTITIPNGALIDLGAVAKGSIGDETASLLREHGVTSALINLGGNVQAVGTKPDGLPWRIGVRDPLTDGNFGVLEIEDMAVVTSGSYERYFTDEAGNMYWHILNPQTGRPAQTGLMSVTVIAPEGKQCDALSTALFVMGPEMAVDYWRTSNDFEMLLVMNDGSIWLTEGLEDIFTLNDQDQHDSASGWQNLCSIGGMSGSNLCSYGISV